MQKRNSGIVPAHSKLSIRHRRERSYHRAHSDPCHLQTRPAQAQRIHIELCRRVAFANNAFTWTQPSSLLFASHGPSHSQANV
jgi:hypothetical protein